MLNQTVPKDIGQARPAQRNAVQRTRAIRWIARGTAVLLLAPLGVSAGTGAVHAEALRADETALASAGETSAIQTGELSWGVRSTIRNYLENFGHTEGWVAAYEGARYQRGGGAAHFPVASGTVDQAAGTASISFAGQLEMYGFGEDWLYFEDVRMEIADGTAEIVVDMIESYNVKTRTDDLVLARYQLGADALAADDSGRISITTERGVFSDEVALTHLPAYGGPTYAAPNNWTDPLTLELVRSTEGGGTEGPGEGPGTGEGTGPYGVSTGTPYADTTATIRVTPAYAVRADGATEVTVEGFGFDPGSATEPGTGSGGIYVGFGTMKDTSRPEQWRRSAGGSSGPVGIGDYTYGAPMFVANQNSADGDVANAMMDASGYWSFTTVLPGGSIPSYFGDTIDCVALQCGFFSFGAHGKVNASNEAFAPVFFAGQDESGWPDRDDDGGPVVVPTPEKPTTAPALPAREALTEAGRGGVQLLSTANGTALVSVGTAYQNSWLGVAVYSDPQFIDWYLVPANGRISVPLPTNLADGEHALAVLEPDGTLVGWAGFELGGPDGGPVTEPGKSEPHGSSTGTNAASGAKLTVSPAKSLADRDQKVTLTGTGYPTSNNGDNVGGVYILFGWVDKMPSAGGTSSKDYAYADGQVTYQWMVNYPGNTTQPDAPVMDANGGWTTEFTVYGSSFTSANGISVDCYKVQCGVFTIGAHGKANTGAEVFTPVYFDETVPDPSARPTITPGTGVQANPNVAAQNAGVGVNGGLAALGAGPSAARTTLFAGLLLLSLGLLGGAALFARRGGAAAAAAAPRAIH